MSDRTTTHRLVRNSTGSDTVFANGATVPSDSECIGYSAIVPDNKGANTHIEVMVVGVSATGVTQARGSCTFDLRTTTVVDRSADARLQLDGSSWPDVSADSVPVTGAGLQQWIRVPFNGGKVFLGMENLANAPGGATTYQIWAKPVSE